MTLLEILEHRIGGEFLGNQASDRGRGQSRDDQKRPVKPLWRDKSCA
jgi:hypothetical protein